mmetsp:Transcript_25025/g.50285  ORF Transcript_25025/g.50285 Transcript_25025/m.50285 type:complete len:102 (+) Transcript_25025:318-623(+)
MSARRMHGCVPYAFLPSANTYAHAYACMRMHVSCPCMPPAHAVLCAQPCSSERLCITCMLARSDHPMIDYISRVISHSPSPTSLHLSLHHSCGDAIELGQL